MQNIIEEKSVITSILGVELSNIGSANILKATLLETPLGPMLAIADELELYLLEFVDRRGLDREIEGLRVKMHASIVAGSSSPLISIKFELKQYFEGILSDFKTPARQLGSPFQIKTWQELQKIPYGETRSYYQIALALEKPKSFRAVAQANGANKLAIMIPCHRVINANGELGGYGGGLHRKKWLLDHEGKWLLR